MKKKSTTQTEKAYQIIEEMIVTLELAPGAIFSETGLSEQLGIGRTPLREALKKMANEQLVTAIARKGIMVVEISIADQIQLLEARRVLDHLIAQRAARKANHAERNQFRHFATEIYAAAGDKDLENYMRIDYAFDHLSARVANNKFVTQAVSPLHVHSRRFWYAYQQYGDWLQIAANHQALMASIAQGDEAEAGQRANALIDYLTEFTKSILEEI